MENERGLVGVLALTPASYITFSGRFLGKQAGERSTSHLKRHSIPRGRDAEHFTIRTLRRLRQGAHQAFLYLDAGSKTVVERAIRHHIEYAVVIGNEDHFPRHPQELTARGVTPVRR